MLAPEAEVWDMGMIMKECQATINKEVGTLQQCLYRGEEQAEYAVGMQTSVNTEIIKTVYCMLCASQLL